MRTASSPGARVLLVSTLSLACAIASLSAQGAGRERALDDALNALAGVLAGDIAGAKATTVAVLEFGDAEGRGGGEAAILGRYAAWVLPGLLKEAGRGSFTLVDRGAAARLLAEQEFGLSGAVADPARVGRLLACQVLVFGSIIPLGADALSLGAKAVSVETGSIVSSFSKRVSLTPDVSALAGRESSDAGAKLRIGAAPEAAYGLAILGSGGEKRRRDRDGVTWILAKPGEEYRIELRNDTDRRVGVALFVDGVNTAFMRREAPSGAVKWILPPRSRVVIPGWQVDMGVARKFIFSGKSGSLAVSMGRGEEVGLISASFFPEEASPPKGTEQEAGTAAGAAFGSKVESVNIFLEPRAVRVAVLRYDYSAGLAARGVDARE